MRGVEDPKAAGVSRKTEFILSTGTHHRNKKKDDPTPEKQKDTD